MCGQIAGISVQWPVAKQSVIDSWFVGRIDRICYERGFILIAESIAIRILKNIGEGYSKVSFDCGIKFILGLYPDGVGC